ncbi:hypothetical protein N7470_001419 [Penicillium chermesinum]|nr:hypothetical protein N7470_001419 [Penicillium chermesinum]
MADIPNFISTLEIAQKKEKFTPEVQEAAAGIDVETLKAAVAAALAAGETDEISDPAQAAALKAGFEFAVKACPGPFEKKDLYVYFKVARGEVVEKPGMFDMVKKQLFGEWEKVKHFSKPKAEALYIQFVDTYIGKYGTRDE